MAPFLVARYDRLFMPAARLACITWTGFTMKKNTAAAMLTNWIAAVMNEPYRNRDLWIVNDRLLKSTLPTIAPMIGMIRSATNAFRTAANATPITNATANSMRFPLIRKSLNSFTTDSMPTPAARRPDSG